MKDFTSIVNNDVETIIVELDEAFDAWYENFLMGQKTNLENLDYINMLRIYDVVLDINEQVQLTNKITVVIHLLPSLIRFNILFPGELLTMSMTSSISRFVNK